MSKKYRAHHKKPDHKLAQKQHAAKRRRLIRLLVISAVVLVCTIGVALYINSRNAPEPSKNTQTQKPSVKPKPRVVLRDTTPGETLSDITYCNNQKLDIYEPRTIIHERSPIVIYIHGGGWVLNDKSSEPDQLALLDGLRDVGYSIVSIDYSKVPEAYYPRAIEDSLCAVRFLRASSEKYYLSKKDVAVYGFSAGGYLAAKIGLLPNDSKFETKEHADQSSRVSAVITLAGLFDFTDGLSVGNRERIARFLQDVEPSRADVMEHISADDPPFLLVHGVDDQYVPLEQDGLFAEALRNERISVDRLVVQYAEHGLNPTGGEPIPSRDEVRARMTAFIRSHLK